MPAEIKVGYLIPLAILTNLSAGRGEGRVFAQAWWHFQRLGTFHLLLFGF
jgi:hypothetical protein